MKYGPIRCDDDLTDKSANDRTSRSAFAFDPNHLRLTRYFPRPFNLFRSFKPYLQKYSSSNFPKYVFLSLHPASMRGANASSRTRGGDAMDALGSHDERRSRGRPSRVVPIPRRWDQACGDEPAGDGGYQARHSRESTKQPLKPSRRECRLFRLNLW